MLCPKCETELGACLRHDPGLCLNAVMAQRNDARARVDAFALLSIITAIAAIICALLARH